MTIASILIALGFNCLDLVTGVVTALKEKDLKSSKLRDGLFKKVGFVFCYLIAWIVDNYGTEIGFSIGVPVLPVIILYVCSTELVSIIENISVINPDIVPEKIMDMFHVKHEED